MPKRKQQAPPPTSESEEQEQQEASGSEPGTSDSSSDDSSDEFPSGAEDDSEGGSSDDEEGEAFDKIDVDFGFYCPQDKDFQGLRTLLQNYLDGQQWACSDLADAIIQQGSTAAVGTVIKCGEEDDPIGVATVLNLRRHADAKPLQELHDFLLAGSGEHRQRLEKAWAAPGTGLLINERLVNCPPQLAEPLQDSLFIEMEEAAEDEELPQAERDAFKLKQFIMVVRAYTDPTQHQQQGASGGSGKKKKKQKGGGGGAADAQPGASQLSGGLVHFLPEAECYQQAAEWLFTMPVADRLVGKDELQPCRCVMLVTAARAAAARKQLAAMLMQAQQ